jgi:hypothetical protein
MSVGRARGSTHRKASIHALDEAVGAWAADLGGSMLDIVAPGIYSLR